jgi:phosphoglycolate phosphatase
MPIKLIIFDLDGTLVDSSIDITNAINYAIAPFGIQPLSVKNTKDLVGEGITRLMEKLVESHKSEIRNGINKEILVKRFLEHYSAHLIDNTTVYPKVKETLEGLKDYKKAVISNKRESLSIKILNDLDLLKYFDLVLGSDSTPEKKPSPVPVRYVMERLNVSEKESIIVGDSNFDIEAGKAAGLKTIAVTYGYRPLELLKNADYMINSFDEIIECLKKIN